MSTMRKKLDSDVRRTSRLHVRADGLAAGAVTTDSGHDTFDQICSTLGLPAGLTSALRSFFF